MDVNVSLEVVFVLLIRNTEGHSWAQIRVVEVAVFALQPEASIEGEEKCVDPSMFM